MTLSNTSRESGVASGGGPSSKGPPVKVVVVDDSAVARGMWVRALGRSSEIQIITSFHDGKPLLEWLAVKTIDLPDVILLDIEMPGLSGLEALPKILALHPKIKVIIASAHSPLGSKNAVLALTLGAVDFISKPSSLSPGSGLEKVENELIEKVLQYRQVDSGSTGGGAQAIPLRTGKLEKPAPGTFGVSTADQCSILVVGCSTGGPQALLRFFSLLPKPFNVPVLVVQHMPPRFTTLLAASISDTTGHECREAVDGDSLLPGRILLAPGDYHLQMKRAVDGKGISVVLNQNPPENWCRPAVDPLFRSAAELFGPRVLAMVLTGMGEDGRRGCESVHARGGKIFVQDEASCVVWGMPGAVARAGLALEVLPIPDLVSRATRLTGAGSRPATSQFTSSPRAVSQK